MRTFILIAGILAISYAAPRADFCAKLKKLAFLFWSQDNLCKIADAIMTDVVNKMPMANITDKGLSYVTPCTPATDYLKLLNLMSSMDSCLSGTNSKTLDVCKLAAPAISAKLKAVYDKIIAKVKTMTGKTVAEKLNQGYTIALSAFTKPLTQSIITASSKTMSPQQWNCAVKNLPPIVNVGLYNCTRPAAG